MAYAEENRAYWSARAPGYGNVHRREWTSGQRDVWRRALEGRLRAHFAQRGPSTVRVLEVGTGPGFFAMLLAQAGYRVTAVDYTPAMLEQARLNAGDLLERIRFMQMDAENLDFADESFDAVISRNLTWNLPHPGLAYAHWSRVLKRGGLLLNFDANWYRYLSDVEAAKGHAADRERVAAGHVPDDTAGTDVAAMEALARRAGLTAHARPAWDVRMLTALGLSVRADHEIWREVWTHAEHANNASTPLFMVHAVKPDC